ncbi:MAG TPA: J domain-containing protein [Byssovorax sp.]|jgi:curved DNA-binding protein
MPKNLYETLGVTREADEDAIKKAFRKLAMKYHPDKNPGKANEQRFKDVNQAHEVLSDKQKRALYDEFGEAALSPGFDPERARLIREYGSARGPRGGPGGGVNPQDFFGGAGGAGGADFSDLLGDLFGQRQGARGPRAGRGVPRATKGQDVESEVTIDFVSAVRGATLSLQRDSDQVSVRVPPGATEGSRIRIAGQGTPGFGGGPPGDLLLTIHVEAHPFFKREGDDLYLDVPITLAEAYRGEKIRVPTPEGEVNLKVPARTQTGALTRLRGKGVGRKGKEPGDLYVRFLVHVPTEDSPKVAAAIDALADAVPDPRGAMKF